MSSLGITIHLLRRGQAPEFLLWLVPAAVAAALLPAGLRPEPLSIALIMVGLVLVLQTSWVGWKVFLGFMLLCLGAATAPRMTPFGAVLGGFGCHHLLKLRQGMGKPPWPVWCLGAIALAGTVIVFLCMIHFRLEEFWRTFHLHAAARVTEHSTVRNLKAFFLSKLGVTFWPVLFLVPVLGLLALRQPGSQLTGLAFALAGAFALAVLIKGLGFGAAWFAVLAVLCPAKSVLDGLGRRRAVWLQWTIAGVVLLSLARPLMNVAGLLGGAITYDLGEQRQAALALRATPGHPVLVDAFVARRLFDYKVPEGFLDIFFSPPFPYMFITGGLTAGDIFLVGDPVLEDLRHDTFLEADPPPRWNPLNARRWSFERSPYRIHIVSAEQCKATRPEVIHAGKTP